MANPPLKERRVDVKELQQIFNEGRYWERAQAGEFTTKITHNSHPAPVKSGQPFCTRSQAIHYYAPDNSEIARVHQYLLPDNTIGASGRPDPKWLLHEGTILHPHRKVKPNQSTSFPPTQLQRIVRRIKKKISHIWRWSRRQLRLFLGSPGQKP